MSPTVAMRIPQGYVELALTESPTAAMGAEMTGLLNTLVDNGARYCGIGRHAGSTGPVVTSWLTVYVHETIGGVQNPRLVLKSLAEAKIAAGTAGEIVVGELEGRPILCSERASTPRLHVVGKDPATVYQLQVVVAAADGSAVAAIELSTRSVADGPRFRTMVMQMARSVRFVPQSRSTLLRL